MRLRIAIQKTGRLHNESMDLLSQCGLKIRLSKQSLLYHAENFPVDILLVRDDDIPALVSDSLCDLGIVGENVLYEYSGTHKKNDFDTVKSLGFSQCRLSIAFPMERVFLEVASLEGLRIATSYPYLLTEYLEKNQIHAKLMIISGSVEIAPRLGMADAICDLVATGKTLEENNLKEVVQVMQSQAVLIKKSGKLKAEKQSILDLCLRRIDGVLKAQESKYIMFHLPKSSLESIKPILPGCETPTVMPLEGTEDKVAVHVVSREGVFWSTLEKLKDRGASSILVLPIEKMLN